MREEPPLPAAPLAGRRVAASLAVLVALVPVLLGALLVSSALDDEAYLSFTPARHLAEHGTIRNANGEPVECSSSLLSVLVLALLLRTTGADLATLGTLLSAAGGAATAALGLVLARRVARAEERWLAGLAALAAAAGPSLVLWSWSGLETTVQAALGGLWVLAVAAHLERGGGARLAAAAAATVALLFVRPETPLLLATGGALALLVARLQRRGGRAAARRGALLLAVLVVSTAALVLGRLWAFGSALPQPVVAKAAWLEPRRVVEGLRYVLASALGGWRAPATLLALAGIVALARRRAPVPGAPPLLAPLVLGLLLAQALFAAASGGDWMPEGRFLLPALPLAAATLAPGARAVAQLTRGRVPAPACLGVVLAAQLAGTLHLARAESPGAPAWSRAELARAPHVAGLSPFVAWNRHRNHDARLLVELRAIVERVHAATARPVTVLSGQMGLVTHHLSGELGDAVRFVDRYGLATRDVTDCPATRDRRRTSVGRLVPYGLLLGPGAGAAACGLARPEVVWDWSDPAGRLEALLASRGYVVRYRQDGLVPSGSALLPGLEVRARELIAVRGDLAAAFDAPPHEHDFGAP